MKENEEIVRGIIPLTPKQALIAFAVLMVTASLVIYGITLNKKREKELSFLEKVSTPQAEEKAVDLAQEVGKLIELPQGEVPSLATVTGVEKLRNQEFYKNALDGDRVLIYQKAHMAYLYRPSTRKLINVMAVAFEAEEQERKATFTQQVASASDSAVFSTPSGTIDTSSQINQEQ